MIDQSVFKVEWGLLCERFNRSYSKAMAVRYYHSLSDRMSTEEFQKAAQALFERSEFFPKPDDFIQAARPDSGEAALDQWMLCERIMRGDDVLDRMSQPGRKTVALMGGPDGLRNTPIDEVHFRRAEFLRLFSDAIEIHRRERGELPPWTERDSDQIRALAPDLKLLGGDP